MASNQVFTIGLLGPLRTIKSTAKVIVKVNNVSAIAPVCKSTFKEGPFNMCLYCKGMTSLIANAPPTAPAACQAYKISRKNRTLETTLYQPQPLYDTVLNLSPYLSFHTWIQIPLSKHNGNSSHMYKNLHQNQNYIVIIQ